MRAAVLEALQQPLVVKEVPDPACPPNGAVVRTEAEGHVPAHGFHKDPIEFLAEERLPSDLVRNLEIGFPGMLGAFGRQGDAAGRA